jgi:hypothetical protein
VTRAATTPTWLVLRISRRAQGRGPRDRVPVRPFRIIGIDEFDLDMPLEGDFLLTKHHDMPG